MNWIQRKIYLYNVTFGLYMLDWWERYLFNTLVIVLMWFVLYNGSRYVTEFCKSYYVLTIFHALCNFLRIKFMIGDLEIIEFMSDSAWWGWHIESDWQNSVAGIHGS